MSKNKPLIGLFLLISGVLLLLERLQFIDGDIFLLLLGIAFIITYFVKRKKAGLLIAGSFLSWLGIYTVLLEQTYFPILTQYSGGLLFTCLGLAFLTIFIHTYRYKGGYRYWPLYPGLGLIFFAIILEFDFSFIPREFLSYIESYWPALLIIWGLIILLTSKPKNNVSE